MPTCRFCNSEIPAGTERCRGCGAWLDQEIPAPRPEGQTANAGQAPAPSATPFEQELLDLLRQGRKIEAIKRYREATGVGLKEAKDAVEALAARHGIAAKGSGCAGVVLIAVVVAVALAMI